MAKATKQTPMMQQYMDIKAQYPDHILFFRMGDFYEMFHDDAVNAAPALGLTLTTRGKAGGGEPIPLAGVPHHSAQTYIAKLIRAGFKVAVCDQLEDPKQAKGIVKRGVTRLISAGTLIDETLLEDKVSNYLASVCLNKNTAGIAFADLSTGEFGVTECELSDLPNELTRLDPAECIFPEKHIGTVVEKIIKNAFEGPLVPYPDWAFEQESAEIKLNSHFKTDNLRGFGVDGPTPVVGAAGAAIRYLEETQLNKVGHLSGMSFVNRGKYLLLDKASVRNLELTRAAFTGDEGKSLLGVIDRTRTAMGGRLQRTWLLRPLADVSEIHKRQSAVEHFMKNSATLEGIQGSLRHVGDLERLIAKICSARANGRDLVALKNSLQVIPEVKEILKETKGKLQDINGNLDSMSELVDYIDSNIVEEPPVAIMEGGIIKSGVDEELDSLRDISKGGKKWMAQFQATESEKSGIPKLKIGFNKVFGYYIEVTHAHKDKVPDYYIRKQTLVNAERYITPELKEYEEKVLQADEKISQLEYELFCKLRDEIALDFQRIQKNATLLAELDVLSGFAEVGLRNNYVLPVVNDSDVIKIKDGRHPVVEQALPPGKFVPNDLELDLDTQQIIILTGPNMAGKSTYIRQAALLIIMAQMGCPVPATEMEIGLVDRVFTRVGASDEIAKGQSTFMVEMTETANILNNATPRSFIVLDEVGRGTSTFDGVSIAWAITEYLHQHKATAARTLFATHYHELTELCEILPRVKNFTIAVEEDKEDIIFLRKIIEGGTDKSYGIHVARLAGIPKKVIERSKEILGNLEAQALDFEDRPKLGGQPDGEFPKIKELQLTFFGSPNDAIVEEMKKLKLDELSPIDALLKLKELQEKIV